MVSSAFQTQALSPAQLDQYERDGYFIGSGLFSRSEISEIAQTFDEQAKRGVIAGLNDLSFEPGDPLAGWPRMMHPQRHADKKIGALSMRYMLDSRVGRVLHDLIGEEALAAQVMYYFKPPGARGQALHQDNFYLRVRPGTCIAAWASIDDADADNGTLVVVPGTHKMDVVCPHAADAKVSISPHEVDLPAGYHTRTINLKSGDVLFFNGSLIHGSYHNKSDRFRRAFITHYVPMSTAKVTDWCRPLYTFGGETIACEFTKEGGECGGEVVLPATPH